MASVIILIATFVAVANAGYVWVDEQENDAPPGYKRMYVPPLAQPPPLPPGFGQLPPLAQPPPLYVRDYSQGYQHFPSPFAHMNNMNNMNIPSPSDIKNIKSEPGRVFNGVSVKSVSGFGTDEDGKSIRTGGTTIVVNEDGEVKETKVGKNPPNIEDPIVFPSPHRLQWPQFPEPVPFEPFVFEPFKPFKPFTFKPIEPITFKPIDMNYKPGEGENYVAVSHSTHSESSNIDGVVSNSGGSNSMLNDNGKTDQEAVEFRNDPKNAGRNENEE